MQEGQGGFCGLTQLRNYLFISCSGGYFFCLQLTVALCQMNTSYTSLAMQDFRNIQVQADYGSLPDFFTVVRKETVNMLNVSN